MALQAKVLLPDVADYPFARFEEELARSMNRQSSETVATRRQLQKIEAEIRNCTRAIASEGLSSFLLTRLASEAAELETQHRDLTEKLAASKPRATRLRLRDSRRFVETRLQNLQSIFGGEPRLIRATIAQHVQKSRSGRQGKATSRRVCGIGSAVWPLEWCPGTESHHACVCVQPAAGRMSDERV